MERSSLARQVKSVERSIAFLQQEQLALLHGLHLEILSLQKRCTELTCDLNEKPPGRNEADVQEEEALLEARCREVEGRLTEQQCSLQELRGELGQKGALVGALRASLKEKERRFLEELKRRSHRTTVLSTELQKQTEAAAYLSFQLRTAQHRLHQQQGGAPSRAPSGTHAQGPAAVRPKRRAAGVPGGGGGQGPAAQFRAERVRECVPRERVKRPAEPKAMPDPALFLYPRQRPRARSARQHRLPGDRDREEGPDEPPCPPLTLAAATAQSKAE